MLAATLLFCCFFTFSSSISSCLINSSKACYPVSVYRTGGYAGRCAASCQWELISYILTPNSPPVSVTWPDDIPASNPYASVEAQAVDVYGRLVFNGNQVREQGPLAQVLVPTYLVTGDPFINTGVFCNNPIPSISALRNFKATSSPQLSKIAYPVAVYRTAGQTDPMDRNVEARCFRACDGWWLLDYILGDNSSLIVSWPPTVRVQNSAYIGPSDDVFNNLVSALIEVQAIDALGRLVYRNAARNCTSNPIGGCDLSLTQKKTRKAVVIVNSSDFRLNFNYTPPFSYCNYTVATSFPETLVVVPLCMSGQAYVRRSECNTSFFNGSLPVQLVGTDYGKCSHFSDTTYCSPSRVGWTDNLIINGKGQFPNNMFWQVTDGNFSNQGSGLGFLATNQNIKTKPVVRSQLINLVASGVDVRLLDNSPLTEVVVQLQPTMRGTDLYRFRVELRATANGPPIGNAIFNEQWSRLSELNVTLVLSGRPRGSVRFLYFQDSSSDESDFSNDGPYIRDVAVYLNLNECLENNGGCHPLRFCLDQPAPPALCGDCQPGYQKDGLYNCTKTEVCLLSTLCPPFSKCVGDNSLQGYECVCIAGYSLNNNSVCEDVNECIGVNGTNGGCGPNSTCLNVQGAAATVPICIPLISNCSLAINNGGRSCSVLVPQNSGGQNLSIGVTSGSDNFDPVVYFGPSFDPQRFTCQSASFSTEFMSCALPVGAVGQDLAFSFLRCAASTCYLVDARQAGTFGFPAPTISSGTLKLYPSGSSGSSITSATNFGELVSFNGLSFIDATQSLKAPSYVVAMVGAAKSFSCRLQPTTQVSMVVCETPAASGGGYRFQIILDSVVLVTGNDVYNYPMNPIILSVSGCPISAGNGTAGCPTVGQIMISISGTGFSSTPAVFVGGKVCNRLSVLVAGSRLECQLPAFGGKSVDVVVITSSSSMSLPAPLVSYAPPNITSMSGCPGLLSTAFEATECNRRGNFVLTFSGTNFGATQPTIVIGNTACDNVTVVVPHQKVQCTAPANIGANLDVQFMVAGSVSSPSLKLSYEQCKPGTVFANLSCVTCPAGKYSGALGLSACIQCPEGSSSSNGSVACTQCPLGFYANGSMSSCEECAAGTFSQDLGTAKCSSCLEGTFTNRTSSVSCLDCPSGTFQGVRGGTSCIQCSKGDYAEFERSRSCQPCTKGKFNSATGQSKCSDCPLGTAYNDVGATNCTPCTPGTEAPAFGTALCSQCRLGYSAPFAGATACVPCEAGRAQGLSGQSTCKVCSLGTAQTSTGRDVCDPCLPGTYNDGSSPSLCLECDAGKHAEGKSSSTCEVCEVGTFSELASKSCSKCIFGYYTSDNSSDNCLPCPIGAVATETRETCECPVGYYGARSKGADNRTVLSCIKCKKGSRCDQPGVTLQTMEVLNGYWRPEPLSEKYYPCRNRQLCLGGLNSTCLENREGVLCGICKEGYTASSSEKACTLCPSQGVSWGYTVLILLALFLVLLLCYFITLKIYNLQQKLLIDLSKEQDAKEVIKMQELINEYNIGDEYFETIRQETYGTDEVPAEGAGQDVNEAEATATTAKLAPHSALESVTVQAQHLLNAYLLRKSRNIRKAPNFIYKVKILLGFFQVASLMPLNSGIEWPKHWQGFIVAFSVFNFDFVPWSNLGCATQVDYLDKAMIVGFVPIVVILFLGLVTYLYFRVDTRLLIDTQLEVQQKKESSWRQFVKLVLFTIFLLYPFASKITLAVYNCVTVENHSYLVADLTISCEDSKYVTIACINIAFLILYPLGVPLAYFFLLNRAKNTFRDSRTLLQYGFLYDAYANDRWYWEILDMLHKLMLTSLVTFLPTGAVLIASMAVTVGYMILLLLGHPYIRKGDDRFHLWVQVNLYLLALMGQILGTLENPYSTTFASPDAMEILLSTLLILINIGLLLAFLIIAGRNVRKLYFTVQKTKPGLKEDSLAPHPIEPESITIPQEFFAQKKPKNF